MATCTYFVPFTQSRFIVFAFVIVVDFVIYASSLLRSPDPNQELANYA